MPDVPVAICFKVTNRENNEFNQMRTSKANRYRIKITRKLTLIMLINWILTSN